MEMKHTLELMNPIKQNLTQVQNQKHLKQNANVDEIISKSHAEWKNYDQMNWSVYAGIPRGYNMNNPQSYFNRTIDKI